MPSKTKKKPVDVADEYIEMESLAQISKDAGEENPDVVHVPPTKRLKRDFTKEAEDELPNCEECLEDSSIPISQKFDKITSYLNSILENNVNTLQFGIDFNEWTKQKLLLLMGEMRKTSIEFYQFLCSVLKVAPTIIEGVCEKVLGFIYQHHVYNKENNEAMENFIEKLSITFEKLHRYPKLIAKLLCSTRENIESITETASGESKKGKKRKSAGLKTAEEITEFILPRSFMKSFCSTLNLLPVGQIIDLWKTLDHNLTDECIKKLEGEGGSNSKGNHLMPVFLTVLVHLIEAFLLNIKVADYSVPLTTVGKVAEMMMKLRDTSLHDLGRICISNSGSDFIQPFLRLSAAWGTLHEFMLVYNKKYAVNLKDPSQAFEEAEDLTFLFPYLTTAEWLSIWNIFRRNGDSTTGHLLVSLVALKLKYLAVIDQQRKTIMTDESSLSIDPHYKNTIDGDIEIKKEEDNTPDNLTRSIKVTAEFVWTHQHLFQKAAIKDGDVDYIKDVLDLASTYINHEKIIEYANMYTCRLALPDHSANEKLQWSQMQSIMNVKFRVALILESLHEGMKRAAKMGCNSRFLKKFTQEVMDLKIKIKILEEFDFISRNNLGESDEVKKCLQLGIQIVNELITLRTGEAGKVAQENEELSSELLKETIMFLEHQALDRYPKILKTLGFLSCSLILTALIGHEKNHEIIKGLIAILSACGQNSQGNEFLFQVNWTGLFDLLWKNVESVSQSACEKLTLLTLNNIYISPKIAKDFGETCIDMVCENLDLTKDATKGCPSISVLEFILEEVIDGKSKSTSLLKSHYKKLANIAVSKLSDGSIITELHSLIHGMKKLKKKKKGGGTSEELTQTKTAISSSFPFVSRVMQTCYLLLKGISFMNVEDASEYNVIVLPYLQFAIDLLEVNKTKKKKTGGYERRVMYDETDKEVLAGPLFYCLQFLIESLKSFEEFRSKLPQDFLPRLWDSSCTSEVDATVSRCASSNKENGSLNANIARKAKSRSSQKGILQLILEVTNEEEFQTICDSMIKAMGPNEMELSLVAHILSNVIDAEIKTDETNKKQIRRSTIELSLYKCLEQIQMWKETEDFIRLALPYVEFQTKLLRTRKRMCNLNTLAVCLSSVTAVPLDKIEDVATFKTVFLSVGDLLNVLAMHCVDVLSFRTHIFLQCFQFLVQSLVKRADQRNQLTDREIYDLRQCGHCIERICQSSKVGKQEFARVSPYLIVVMLQQFDKITVYPVVKNPLLSGCYKLLDMCDDHGISHVNSMLTKGSREVFKTVYDVYNKFYRYKGKV